MTRQHRTHQFRFSWLDFKVGLRMLSRYPGLTTVGTVAIAVAIALGTIYFEAVNKFHNPRLPIRDADRVVSILNWDASAIRPEGRSLHDFSVWRAQAKTVDNLGTRIPLLTCTNGPSSTLHRPYYCYTKDLLFNSNRTGELA